MVVLGVAEEEEVVVVVVEEVDVVGTRDVTDSPAIVKVYVAEGRCICQREEMWRRCRGVCSCFDSRCKPLLAWREAPRVALSAHITCGK